MSNLQANVKSINKLVEEINEKEHGKGYKKKKKAIFEVLNKRYDEKLGRYTMPQSLHVPNTDRVFDPGDNQELDIAFIERVRPSTDPNSRNGDNIELGFIVFERARQGIIELDLSKPKDIKIYEYLNICSFNYSNRGKEWHIPPVQYLFKELTPEKDAENSLQEEEQYFKAFAAIREMDVEELSRQCKGLNLQSTENPFEMQQLLAKEAKKDPFKFFSSIESSENECLAIVKGSEELSLIVVDGGSWKWMDSENVILNIPKGVEKYKALAGYLNSSKGSETKKKLEDLIKASS